MFSYFNMNNFFQDDFQLQPKFKNGVKQKGSGGGTKKKEQTKRKKSNGQKEIYNSKHVRIMNEKIEISKNKQLGKSK